MPKMTKEQLGDYIKEVVSDIVTTTVKEAVEPLKQQQTRWADRIFSGGHRPEPMDRKIVLERTLRSIIAGQGRQDIALDFARKAWQAGDDDPVMKALSAADFSAGGALLGVETSRELIALLRPLAVVRRLNPSLITLVSGAIQVPKLTGGATATYTGEGAMTETAQTTGQLNLTARKLTAIVPISNTLIRYSTRGGVGAEGMVRDDIAAAMAVREDVAFIRDDGTQNTPKGMRYWANSANVFATAGKTLANITTDLKNAVLKLKQADVRMIRPAWLLSPRSEQELMTIRTTNGPYAFRDEMLQGRLWTYPFGVTSQIPENLGAGSDESEVYLVDMADAVIADAEQVVIEAATQSTIVTGSTTTSAWQSDQTHVRAIAEHDFGMRYDKSVAVITGVQWGT